MNIKTTCPSCGVHTVVYLTSTECSVYRNKRDLPKDFIERTICDCCTDDDYIFKKVV